MTDFLNWSSSVAPTRGYTPIDMHKQRKGCISRRNRRLKGTLITKLLRRKSACHSICEISGEEFDVTESLGSAQSIIGTNRRTLLTLSLITFLREYETKDRTKTTGFYYCRRDGTSFLHSTSKGSDDRVKEYHYKRRSGNVTR